jgi:hypothetical protein
MTEWNTKSISMQHLRLISINSEEKHSPPEYKTFDTTDLNIMQLFHLKVSSTTTLQKKYAFVPADKASNNVVIV